MTTKSLRRLARARGAVGLACGLLLGAAGAALAASGTSTTALASVQQTTRTYAEGPEAMEEKGPMDGVGGIGGVDPFAVQMPAGSSAYDALVTVTFQYRTTGKGRFSLGLAAGTGPGPGAHANDLTRRPAAPWPLAAAGVTNSSTVQFVVPALKAATTYYFSPGVKADLLRDVGRTSIRTSNVVMTVQLTPRKP